MKKTIKVIGINGSHRGERGISQLLLDKFLQGAQTKGGDCKIIYPSKMNIASCKACHRCILETPGICFQKDDMSSLINQIEEADFLVIAAPVYFDSMPSDIKRMFERLMPILGPVFEFRNGRSYHLTAKKQKLNIVAILLCGNPEREALQSISANFRRIAKNMRWHLSGEFFFSASHLVLTQPELLAKQLDALTKAGKEAVTQNKISKATQDIINTEYIHDPTIIIEEMNRVFQALKKN